MSLPQGLTRMLLETPGTRRVSSQTLMDVRLSRAIEPAPETRIELLLDVFNTFNSTPEERLADDHLQPEFRTTQRVVDPRRAMLGVRLSFSQSSEDDASCYPRLRFNSRKEQSCGQSAGDWQRYAEFFQWPCVPPQ